MKKLFLFIAAVFCAASMSFAQEADTREVITSCRLYNFDRSAYEVGVPNPTAAIAAAVTPETGVVWEIEEFALRRWVEESDYWEYVGSDETLTEGKYSILVKLAISGDNGAQYRYSTHTHEGEDDVTVWMDGRKCEVTNVVNYSDRCYLYAMSPSFILEDMGAGALTVYKGENTNNYVPYYGFYADAYLRAQYVIPAMDLVALKDHKIIKLQYALSDLEAEWTGTVQIHLQEVDYTRMMRMEEGAESETPFFDDSEDAQMVYEGSLSCDGYGKMSITLDDPYTYHGGNLLISFYNVVEGNYIASHFYGQTVNGASVQGYSYSSLEAISPSQRDFIPQTTFVSDTEIILPMDPIVEDDGWVHYDNGEYESSLGSGGSGLVYWGIRIPGGTVTDTYLTRVAIYVSSARHGFATLYIYQSDTHADIPSAGNLLHEQEVELLANDAFQNIFLEPSVEVDPSKDVWIVFGNTGHVNYPATYSYAENSDYARWIATPDEDGNWVLEDVAELTEGNYENMAWMIRGLFASDLVVAYTDRAKARDLTPVSAQLTWTGNVDYYDMVVFGGNVNGSMVLYQNFEDGLGDWTTIDANEDGYDWNIEIDEGRSTLVHYGNASAYSESWIDGVGAITPDNYLVSPKITLGGYLTFWASAAYIGDYAEHFGVAVSLTDNTNPEDFVMVEGAEWTMEDGEVWHRYVVDLSAYAGREGYVAIRHFDCNDQYSLVIDDILIAPYWIEAYIKNIEGTEYLLTGLQQETTYKVRIAPQGHLNPVGGYDIPSGRITSVEFKTPTPCATKYAALEASEIEAHSARISWMGFVESYNLRYKKATFFCDFENGVDGWTTIDADGDGHNWFWSGNDPSNYGAQHPFSGEYTVISESFIDYDRAYNPDNYLITPQIELGDTLSFWHRAINPEYPDDTVAVLVATKDNPALEDFTAIAEFHTNENSDYTQEVIPLEGYSGLGYIAFRHYNSYDHYRFNIDDVTVGDVEWTEMSGVTSPITLTELEPNTKYVVQVQIICDGEPGDWSETLTFTTLEDETGIEQIVDSRESKADSRKILHDGNLYILRDGKIFNAQGARIK